MVQINFARKEINCKIVYYGPGLSGKTTNLEVVHARTPEANKGELTSISTDGDRTLFFDFMPLDLGTVAGMKTKFHLYTVPGQVYYNSTRKLVLLGADGIIFIADSSPDRIADNIQSLENLKENLAEMGRDIGKVPLVIQYNKRDVPGAHTVEELEAALNKDGHPSFEASAKSGEGVFQTLKAISGLVLESINSNERNQTPSKDVLEKASAEGAGDPLEEETPAGVGELDDEPLEELRGSDDGGGGFDEPEGDLEAYEGEEAESFGGTGLQRTRRREDVLRPAARQAGQEFGDPVDDGDDGGTATQTMPSSGRRSQAVRRVGPTRTRGRRGSTAREARSSAARGTRETTRIRRRSSGGSGRTMAMGAFLVALGAGAALAVWKFVAMGG